MSKVILAGERSVRQTAAVALHFQLLCRQSYSKISVDTKQTHRHLHPEWAIGSTIDKPCENVTNFFSTRTSLVRSVLRPKSYHSRLQIRSVSTTTFPILRSNVKTTDKTPNQIKRPTPPITQSVSSSQAQFVTPQPSQPVDTLSSTRLEDTVDVPILTLRDSPYRLPKPLYPEIPTESTSYEDLYYSFESKPSKNSTNSFVETLKETQSPSARSNSDAVNIKKDSTSDEDGLLTPSLIKHFADCLVVGALVLLMASIDDHYKITASFFAKFKNKQQQGPEGSTESSQGTQSTVTAPANGTSNAPEQNTPSMNSSSNDPARLNTGTAQADMDSDQLTSTLQTAVKPAVREPERQVASLTDLLDSTQ